MGLLPWWRRWTHRARALGQRRCLRPLCRMRSGLMRAEATGCGSTRRLLPTASSKISTKALGSGVSMFDVVPMAQGGRLVKPVASRRINTQSRKYGRKVASTYGQSTPCPGVSDRVFREQRRAADLEMIAEGESGPRQRRGGCHDDPTVPKRSIGHTTRFRLGSAKTNGQCKILGNPWTSQ